jgi:adenine-specific DNA methylase
MAQNSGFVRVKRILPNDLHLSDRATTLSYIGNKPYITRRKEMSKFQINTIKEVMGFNDEQTESLINLMDVTGDYPNWSEFSTKQFRSHFKMVLLGL